MTLPTIRVVSRFVPPAHQQRRLAVNWWIGRPRYWTLPLGPVRRVP